MSLKRITVLLSITLWVASSAAWSQPRPDKGYRNWFGHISGGYSLPQGDVSDILDDGYSFRGGATYWPETWPIGIVLDTEYSSFDMSNSAIREINQGIIDGGGEGELTGGDVTSWSFSISGTWSPSESGSGFYVIAGVGMYVLEGQVNENGLVYYPPYCDPWYWWCYPGGVGPGTFPVASQSTTEFGWNAGIGWAWELPASGSQLFVEARYNSALTDRSTTDFMPLSFGWRW